jgi:lipid A 4'-phosphatase
MSRLPPPVNLFGLDALRVVAALTVLASIIFVAFPGIDIAVAQLVHDAETGFVLRDTPLHKFVDAYIRPGLKYVALAGLCVLLLNFASRGRFPPYAPRKGLFVTLSFILGPLILVNGVLKEFIGRARPKHLEMFGGDKIFSRAYWPADQCDGNCSFVSGDVAVAFATLAFALAVSAKWQPGAVAASLIFGILVGYYRIATGAHFMSDATLAGLFCVLLTLVSHDLVMRDGWRRFSKGRFSRNH